MHMQTSAPQVEPRWPMLLALAAVVAMNFALPEALSFGPRWLLAIVYVVFGAIYSIAHARGSKRLVFASGLLLISAVTAGIIASLILLISGLPAHKEQPVELLRSAASLWISNVLVFAAWYWRLDAGGPHIREQSETHESGAFLFPQMALHEESPAKPDAWRPEFVDYLFLSFNTSTAFSPTDTQVLSRWAKALMMLQSVVSLTIIALLAARAVNIL